MSHISCEFCLKSWKLKEDPPESVSFALNCLARYLSLEEVGNGAPRSLCYDCGALLTSFRSLFEELQDCQLRLRRVLEKVDNVLQGKEKEEIFRTQRCRGGGSQFGQWRHKLVSQCRRRLQNTRFSVEEEIPKITKIDDSHSSLGSNEFEIKKELEDPINPESSPGGYESDDITQISPGDSPMTRDDNSDDEVAESPPAKRRKSGEWRVTLRRCNVNSLRNYSDQHLELEEDEKIMETKRRALNHLGKEETARPKVDESATPGRRSLRGILRCSKCGKSFSSSQKLVEHTLLHQAEDDESDQDSASERNNSKSKKKVVMSEESSEEEWSDSGSNDSDNQDHSKKELRSSKSEISRDENPPISKILKRMKESTLYKDVSTDAEAMERFMSSKETVPRFICPFKGCRSWFVLEAEVERHSKMHGSWTCYSEGCEFTTDYTRTLALHEMGHKPVRSGQTFKCLRCDFSSKNKSVVIAHLVRLHLEINLGPFKCPICATPVKTKGFEFPCNLRSAWKKHFRRMHDISKVTPEEVHYCLYCHAYFPSARSLHRHKKVRHLDNSSSPLKKTYECSICGKGLGGFSKIRIHKIKKHNLDPEKDFELECPNVACNLRWHTQPELDHHVQHFHGNNLEEDTTQLCPHCGKSFPHLKAHISMMHNPQLKRKVVVKKPPKPPQTFVCEQCGKVTKNKEKLRIHILFHSGPESWQYSCDQCGRKCITPCQLKIHQRRHKGEKLYGCDVCGQRYADRRDWRRHVTSKHPEVAEQLGITPPPQRNK